METDEVPEIIVRGLSLRDLIVRLRLHGVNDVWELDSILNEEYRDIVADEVPVALLSVELDGKPANVANSILEGA